MKNLQQRLERLEKQQHASSLLLVMKRENETNREALKRQGIKPLTWQRRVYIFDEFSG